MNKMKREQFKKGFGGLAQFAVEDNVDKIFNEQEEKINKAIQKLELMRGYCDDIIHKSCDYNIYTDMIDFIDTTINDLE